MSKQSVKATIDANIRYNGRQLITGQVLNAVLNAMVTDYAEQAALDGLKEKVDALALGAFYGYYPDSDSLPVDVTIPGYAYVGENNPFEIWNFDGESWSDSETSIDMNGFEVVSNRKNILSDPNNNSYPTTKAVVDAQGYVTPQMFKTYPGDDWTDAFNSAVNSGLNVFIPRGLYHVSGTITLSGIDGVTIMGETGSVIYADSKTLPTTSVFSIVNCRNVRFKDLTFESVMDQVGAAPSGHTRSNNYSSNRNAFSAFSQKSYNLYFDNIKTSNMEHDFFMNVKNIGVENVFIDGWYSSSSNMPMYVSDLINLHVNNAHVVMSPCSGDGDHCMYVENSEYIYVSNSEFGQATDEARVTLAMHGGTGGSNHIYIDNVVGESFRWLYCPASVDAIIKNCKVSQKYSGETSNGFITLGNTSSTQDTTAFIDNCEFTTTSMNVIWLQSSTSSYLTIKNSIVNYGAYAILSNVTKAYNCVFNGSSIMYYKASSGGLADVEFHHCVFNIGYYVFSIRDSRDGNRLLIDQCSFFGINQTKLNYIMYNGSSVPNINFVTILGSYLQNIDRVAQSGNDHGGTFINSYIDGVLLTPKA